MADCEIPYGKLLSIKPSYPLNPLINNICNSVIINESYKCICLDACVHKCLRMWVCEIMQSM